MMPLKENGGEGNPYPNSSYCSPIFELVTFVVVDGHFLGTYYWNKLEKGLENFLSNHVSRENAREKEPFFQIFYVLYHL